MPRKVPGKGRAERSKQKRKLSVAFPNDHMDAIEALARKRGVSSGSIVRNAVAEAITRGEIKC